MKTSTLIIINFFLCASLGAQERFFEFIPGWMSPHIEETNNGYLSMGLGSIPEGWPNNHTFMSSRLSFDGLVLDSTELRVDTLLANIIQMRRQMMIPLGEQYLVVGAKQIVDYDYEGMLVWYNEDLSEIEDYRTYDFGVDTRFGTINQINDTTLIVSGNVKPLDFDYRWGTLLNMDLEGNIRWQKNYFNGIDCKRYIRKVLPLSDGGFIMLAQDNIEFQSVLFNVVQTTIIKTDSLGNEEWVMNPGDSENYLITSGGVIEKDDGGILVSYSDFMSYSNLDSNWPIEEYNYSATIYIQEYSPVGDLISTSSFYNDIPHGVTEDPPLRAWPYQLTDMIQTNDGNVLIGGTTELGGVLLKCTEDGEFIWFREHMPYEIGTTENTVTNQLTWILGLTATSDGGYICAGEYISYPGNIYPNGYQSAFALKVDEYGCLEPDCQYLDIEEQQYESSFSIYPNPTKGEFTLSLDESKSGSLSVFDLTGELIINEDVQHQAEIRVDLGSVSSGLYLVKFIHVAGEVYSQKIIVE